MTYIIIETIGIIVICYTVKLIYNFINKSKNN